MTSIRVPTNQSGTRETKSHSRCTRLRTNYKQPSTVRCTLRAAHRRSSTTGVGAFAVAAVVLLLAGKAHPQESKEASAGGKSTTELAKETQNPVANLISVPFQNNFNFGAGTDRSMIWIMNVQPVIPIPLSPDWNLITRTIVPIINQPSLAPGMDSAFGMGDINPSVFLSPANTEGFIWGVGLTTTLPTATASEIGSGKWSMGPTAVGLLMQGPWVVGALASQQWSIVGWAKKDFNQFLMQPFINYNLSDGWYITSSPIITGNFAGSGDNHWTLPIGAGIGKLWRIGKVGLPLNTQIAPYYNARFRAGLAAAVSVPVPVPEVIPWSPSSQIGSSTA